VNRRTRALMALMRWLPRPDPPTPAYLVRIRRELPRPLAHLVLGRGARGVTLEDRRLPTGGYQVPVRVYSPAAPGTLPLVVNLHGGGFVFGNLTGADWLCGHVAAQAEVVVVSVDYRLAPEHPAPLPYQDALAATSWLLDHAEELGADPGRASVLGESAGGNLAALVTLALRDRRRRDPAARGLVGQVLLYPATDLTLSSPSVEELPDAPMLRRTSMEWYGKQYVPQGLPTSIPLDDPRISPLHAADHTDLPPALVVAAGQDPLRDDAVRYAEALRRAGVRVREVLYPDALHGFASIPRFEPAAQRVLAEIVEHLGSL
jgi:acetyl esterase